MNWSLIILLSLTFNLFNYANGLFFVLDPHEERCISRQMNEKETFGGAYFVSGEREEGNKAFIKSADGKIIWEVNGQKNSSFNFVVEKEGVYSLCVVSTGDSQITFSFEFYDEKKNEQLVSVKNIENLNSVIYGIRSKLDIVHSNIRNSAVRRNTHAEISANINSKITFYTAIKVIFLIVFSLFQILMLTNIFSHVKVVNKIQVEDSKPLNKYTASSSDTPMFL